MEEAPKYEFASPKNESQYNLTPDKSGMDALRRLIAVANGFGGQSRHVSAFLLAWWNAEEQGGFDLTRIWAVDDAIEKDMIEVFGFIARSRQYPDALAPDMAELFAQLIANK